MSLNWLKIIKTGFSSQSISLMDGVSAAEYTGADDTQRISHVTCVKVYTVYSCLFNGSCVLDPVIFFVNTVLFKILF